MNFVRQIKKVAKRKRLVAGMLLTLCLPVYAQEQPQAPVNLSPQDVLERLHKPHPRLLAKGDDFENLKRFVETDEQAKPLYQKLKRKAESLLGSTPHSYDKPDGLRLLNTSKSVLDRVYTLAFLYRVSGERRFAERAWRELEAAAKFPDWNPRHFLDTAEMAHAFAIGYDWLYDAWTPDQRSLLRSALIDKALQPALECYRGTSKFGRWVRVSNNWNQVCNGGIGLAALAIAEEAPSLTAAILSHIRLSLPLSLQQFGPDGAWPEGFSYWEYALFYSATFLAALESALGTDFDLAQTPGFSRAGFFPLYLVGPVNRTFNFADGNDETRGVPQMYWLAHKFQQPVFQELRHEFLRSPKAQPHPLDFVWLLKKMQPDISQKGHVGGVGQGGTDKSGADKTGIARGRGAADLDVLTVASRAQLPLDRLFRNTDVALFRSAWNDPNALFLGFKGGHNAVSHSHLDLGSFALDVLGQRWAIELGADDYNLEGYFDAQRRRWWYYRLRAEGQNTLVINPTDKPDQQPAAVGAIQRFQSSPHFAFAIADLTAAYAPHVISAQRGIALLERKRVLVQDEIKAPRPAQVWWFMHTYAKIEVSPDGATAMLSQGDRQLKAHLLSPAGAKFTVMNAEPLPSSPHPAGQSTNSNIRKLAIHLPGVTEARLAVLLVPVSLNGQETPALPKLRPLSAWNPITVVEKASQ